ncbi:Gfo/Idh/MocA family protein [Thioalkalivibrio sp. XN279]|uniref:Gfo/Idh/MocA family protein n=1 Tax=Thioalkalivibrio sp. XN279 TaxID=2714953 RepID=UPI00140D6AFA|nr:Gfo/Idh/MocA family oxidoreductase [Thioalkalivibrio sp. XN279]NHA15370.1 Gfo/Idh/MocA family oxidoreductase [Thioalkalivibrio sp. XN279]
MVEQEIGLGDSTGNFRPLPRPRVALIGGGKIAEQHLLGLQQAGDVRLQGICDLSPALAEYTAGRFGVAGWHTDYRAMLEQDEVDVVHVLTPPATHDRIVRDCLERGCHVIVEKPIALSNEGFNDLWDLAQSRSLRLVENHNYRFNAPIRRLEAIVAQGEIGTLEEVEVRMVLGIRGGGRYADQNLPHPSHCLPAGVVHEFISHLAYLLLNFLPVDERDAMEIAAAWRNHGGGDLFKYDALDALVLSGPAHGRIRFSAHQWPDGFSITLRGSQGVASAELFHPTVMLVKQRPGGQHLSPLMNAMANAGSLVGAGFGSIWKKIRNRTAYEGLQAFLAETYQSLRSGNELPVTYQQMDRTSRLIDRLLAEENRL